MQYRKLILCGIFLACGHSVACGVDVPPVNERDVPFVITHEEGAIVSAYYISVDANGVPSWNKLPDKHFTRTATQTICAAPPGEYAFTTGDFTISKVIDKATPTPPVPVPDDDEEKDDVNPTPVPKDEVVWVYLYDDPKQRGNHPGFAALLTSRYYKDLDDADAYEVQTWSKQDATAKRYFGYVDGIALPAAAIVTQKGKVLGASSISGKDDLTKLIKETTGRE